MIKIDQNNLITNVVNFFKTLGLILLFVLSFPFSLLYWPLKSAISKLSQPIPAVALAAAQAAVLAPASAGELEPVSAPPIINPTESLESSPTVDLDPSVGSTDPDTVKQNDAIKFGNR